VIKERILGSAPRDDATFVARVRKTVPAVLEEHGVTAEQLGLGFHVMISMRFWIRPPLHTPHQSSLDVALNAWRRLSAFRGRHTTVGRHKGPRREVTPTNRLDLESTWMAFREAYLDVLAEHGVSRMRVAGRLDALEEAARPFRERQLKRAIKRCEDMCQQCGGREGSAMAATASIVNKTGERASETRKRDTFFMEERRRQRCAQASERRLERLSRTALTSEDARSRALRRAELAEARSVHRIECLLSQWSRLRATDDRRRR